MYVSHRELKSSDQRKHDQTRGDGLLFWKLPSLIKNVEKHRSLLAGVSFETLGTEDSIEIVVEKDL